MSACSHVPFDAETVDPDILLENACNPGETVHSVKGSVWMRVSAEESSGQFPAGVSVSNDGKNLNIEILNLLGGTEASIEAKEGNFKIEIPSKDDPNKTKKYYGRKSWGGIPVRWASTLFLGRIPCPEKSVKKGLKVTNLGELVVDVGDSEEQYVYKFKKFGRTYWPEFLTWKTKDTVVEFSFDMPEDKTASPQKWTAVSGNRHIEVRWQKRRVNM